MSRTLTLACRQALHAQSTNEVFLLLCEIDHGDLAAPIRVVCDHVDHVSGGDTYSGLPFTAHLPPEEEGRPPRVRVQIDAVTRDVIVAARTITSPPTVTLSVVLASDPNTVEAGPFVFTLESVEYDSMTLSGELGYERVLGLQSPKRRFNPADYPGLF